MSDKVLNGKTINDEYQQAIYDRICLNSPLSHVEYTLDEIGLATLCSVVLAEELKFCPQYGDWLVWDGARWARQAEKGVVYDKVITVLNMLVIHQLEAKSVGMGNAGELERVLKTYRKSNGLDGIVKIMQTMMRTPPTDFDRNPYILNTPVCAYDLRNMSVIADRMRENITQVTNCNLLPGTARCERWYRFIGEIMCGDLEQAAFLQRALGYSILGVNREECMFVALGSQTRNGKGTLFTAIQTALGKEYAQGSDPGLICEGRNGKSTDFNAPQPALRKLTNCRLVVMSESQRDVRLDAASMKALTGRDVLTTRGLYESSFDFTPQFTMWLNTNYLPAVNDDTVFKSDRIWVIKFNAHFDEEKRDLDLKTVFADPQNQPTILQWLIDGVQDYFTQGLNPPDVVRENTMEYKDRFDKIGNFLRECTTRSKTDMVSRGDLYGVYRGWCAKVENRYTPIGSQSFYTDLMLRGYEQVRTDKGRFVKGLKMGGTDSLRIVLADTTEEEDETLR